MERTLDVRSKAREDIRRFHSFIARKVSHRSADEWYVGLILRFRRLAKDAEKWPEADEAGTLGLDLRMLLHGKKPHVYRIIFTIDGDTVNVLRIRHAAQDALTEDDL